MGFLYKLKKLAGLADTCVIIDKAVENTLGGVFAGSKKKLSNYVARSFEDRNSQAMQAYEKFNMVPHPHVWACGATAELAAYVKNSGPHLQTNDFIVDLDFAFLLCSNLIEQLQYDMNRVVLNDLDRELLAKAVQIQSEIFS